ncbi:MAG: hypothetical protein MRZ79_27675 [Bacteroidia bacterium]|nr:hypothetical protein [Bacteroidia bacterium]
MSQDTLISIAILIILPILYWTIIIGWRDWKAKSIDPKTLDTPLEMSPTAMRLIWVGQSNWDMLIINFFEVARKGLYKILWKDNSPGFLLTLDDVKKFQELEAEEQAGISFGGQPLRQINVQIKKTSMIDKLLEKVELALNKRYKQYFLPWKWLFIIGMAISSITFMLIMASREDMDASGLALIGVGIIFLTFYLSDLMAQWMEELFSFHHQDFSPKKLFKSFVISPINLIINYFIKFFGLKVDLDPNNNTIFTTDSFGTLFKRLLIIGLFVLIMAIAINLQGWTFIALLLNLIGQLIFTSYTKTLSPKGIVMRKKLENYKKELEQIPYEYPKYTATFLALDLECHETHLIRPLLTGSMKKFGKQGSAGPFRNIDGIW